MYRIYSTEGLVLKGSDTGEASKILVLFTRELGLLYARAQSVREERSKLRYNLQDFSLAHFNLVRGKNGWRITSAVDAENLSAVVHSGRKEALGILGRVSGLLMRLLHGEEKDPELFSHVISAFRALKGGAIPAAAFSDFEAVLLMRVLARLGYWGEDAILSPFLTVSAIESAETLTAFAPHRSRAVRRINASLRETQL